MEKPPWPVDFQSTALRLLTIWIITRCLKGVLLPGGSAWGLLRRGCLGGLSGGFSRWSLLCCLPGCIRGYQLIDLRQKWSRINQLVTRFLAFHGLNQLLVLQHSQQEGRGVHRFSLEQAMQNGGCDGVAFGYFFKNTLNALPGHPLPTEEARSFARSSRSRFFSQPVNSSRSNNKPLGFWLSNTPSFSMAASRIQD